MHPKPPILVADDDPDLVDAVKELLSGEGYAVTAAGSPEAALAALDAQVFGAVLSDLFDAAGSLEQVAALARRARPTPVGVMSGWEVPVRNLSELGLRFAMLKPFDLADLLLRLAGMLGDPLDPEKSPDAALALRYFRALEAKDWDALARICSPFVRFAGPPGSRFSATLVGRDALLEHSRRTFEQFGDATFRDLAFYQTPGGVAVRYLGAWTWEGKPAQQAGTAILRLANGQIERVGVEMNQALLDRLAPR